MFIELSKTEAELQLLEPVLFYQNVSTSKELRDASNQAEVFVRDFLVEAEMRVDVFAAKKHAEANIKAQDVKLTTEEKRLVEKMMLDGIRAGLDLPENKRDLLTTKKKELSQVCVEFGVSLLAFARYFSAEPLSRKTLMRKLYAYQALQFHSTI